MTRLPLDFIVFYVSDLAASVAYFTDKLGFTTLPVEANDSPTFRSLSNGEEGLGIGLMQVTEAYQPQPGTVELYFKTPELAAFHAALTSHGVEATPIMHLPFGSIFTVHSPDGAPLTLIGKD